MKSTLRFSFRKIFFLVSCFFILSSAHAKDVLKVETDQDRNFHLGIIVRNDFLPNNTFKTYGITAQYPVGDHWFLNYNYHFIATSSGIHFSHMPLCTMGVKYLLLFSGGNTNGLGYAAALLMVVPEGVSYKINPKGKIQFSPYLNPLSLDRLVFEREGQTMKKPWGFALNTGLQVKSDLPFYMYAAADAGITMNYSSGKTVFGAGITIGMRLYNPQLRLWR